MQTATCFLLDIHLGGISGMELQRRLAASGSMRPVIFMTANDDEATRKEAMDAGCIAYLHKPFQGACLAQCQESCGLTARRNKNARGRHVRLGSNASSRPCADHFRSTPISRHFQLKSASLKRAITGSHQPDYSITSSARASSIGGMSRLSERAVCKLITNSNFVAWRTGRSAGFAPLMMVPV